MPVGAQQERPLVRETPNPPATDQAGEGCQRHEVHKPPSFSPTLSAADQVDEGDSSKVHNSALYLFSVSPATTYQVAGTVNNTPASFIVDTGAAVTLISRELWDKAKTPQTKLEPWVGMELVGANGTPMTICGSAAVELTLAQAPFPMQVIVVERITTEAILGITVQFTLGKSWNSLRSECRCPSLVVFQPPRE